MNKEEVILNPEQIKNFEKLIENIPKLKLPQTNFRDKIYFAKVKPNAIIPSKKEEDAGYDIYACIDEDNLVIEPFETKLIPTGIASAFSNDYVIAIRERGSSGIKGLKVSAGVIDSGFRNQWFVAIYNANAKPVVITKEKDTTVLENDYIVYPQSKAIAQMLLLPVPKVDVEEMPYDELLKIKSERGLGKLGSSGK